MFNVLPDILKEEIGKEYRTRRLVVALAFVVFVQVSSLIFLFPSWMVSKDRESEAVSQMNSQNSSTVSQNTNAILQTIGGTNKRINIINTTFEYQKILPVLNQIISAKSKSISLREFTYVSSGTAESTLSVKGISATREALVTFIKNLQNASSFNSVDSPISNLAKDKNIDFTISLKSSDKK